MIDNRQIENHPYADLFPLITGIDFEEFKKDIAINGLREPVWLYEDKILDGRNRYRACKELGINPAIKIYQGNDPLGFVISLNLQRRHLSESQRAMVAARLVNLAHGGIREGQNTQTSQAANLPLEGVSHKQAAEKLNVSERTLRTAKTIKQNATQELIEQVEQGIVSVHAAFMASTLTSEQQKEIVAAIKTGQKPVEVIKKQVHVAQNSGENEWYTPEKFIEAAKRTMGSIDLDPASSELANKTVKANVFFTKAINGLDKTWFGNVWLNPPYEQPLISQFSEKLIVERKTINQAIVLVNNATETRWFQSMAKNADCLCFAETRIKFLDKEGKLNGSPLQGQVFLYFGNKRESFVKNFSQKVVPAKGGFQF
jgi:16S rRNA G966 N2-methylase RsmD